MAELIAAHVAGDSSAADSLAQCIEPDLRRAAGSFLGAEDPDVDDVVGESLIAVLDYLVRRGGFTGNLTGFAVTVAVNRCRNLLAWRRRRRQVPLEPLAGWIADEEASALDLLLDDERQRLLQAALDGVDPGCEHLLRAYYLEGRTIASLRDELHLESVQAVYYRRGVCLQKAFRILNRLFGDCSTGDGPADRPQTPREGGVRD